MNPRPNIKFTAQDRRILNRLQEDIPFVERPWKTIARELKIEEAFLLKRIAFFKKKGVIRRISANFVPQKVNFSSTLVAVRADPENIKRAVAGINAYSEVTHNYKRNAEYNIWFTLVAKNKKRIKEIVSRLKKDKNIKKITEFPALKIFKINVKFPA